jgi:hypothetical protein
MIVHNTQLFVLFETNDNEYPTCTMLTCNTHFPNKHRAYNNLYDYEYTADTRKSNFRTCLYLFQCPEGEVNYCIQF